MVASVSSWAYQTQAQDADAVAMRDAKQKMRRGQALFSDGKFSEAAEAFRAAYRAYPHPAFVYNAGLALEEAGRVNDAAAMYEHYLKTAPDAPDSDEVRGRVVRLRGVDVSAPKQRTEMKSVVQIETQPQGATATVRREGNVVVKGVTPFRPSLSPGDYDLLIEHPKFLPVTQKLTVESGVVTRLVVGLSQGSVMGAVSVISEPPGAEVFIDAIDNGTVGRTPFTGSLPVGQHTVWLRRAGFADVERTIDLQPGDDAVVRAKMTRLETGVLRVIGLPEAATVSVDGEKVGVVPWEGSLPAGVHEVVVVAEGRLPWREQVRIARGKMTPVEVSLSFSTSNVSAWIFGGLTFVSAIVGIGFGIASLAEADSLQNKLDRGTLTSDDPGIENGVIFSNVANIAFAATALFAAATALFFFIDRDESSRGKVLAPRDFAFAPALSPNYAGGVAQWNF